MRVPFQPDNAAERPPRAFKIDNPAEESIVPISMETAGFHTCRGQTGEVNWRMGMGPILGRRLLPTEWFENMPKFGYYASSDWNLRDDSFFGFFFWIRKTRVKLERSHCCLFTGFSSFNASVFSCWMRRFLCFVVIFLKPKLLIIKVQPKALF